MLFNSLDFAIFLPVIFFLYWFATRHSLQLQNTLIVVASYIFYGWWDWKFLSLIVFSTIVDYWVGLQLGNTNSRMRRKGLLWISILVNLGFLGFFKYYNFFAENFVAAFTFFGAEIQANSLNIILPVGISFYTFQTMSYTIDVYHGNLKPTRKLISFAAFVSFFPQLVAGPIERATNLLPQFYTKRRFDYFKAVDGMRQILWGLFKKVVIADNCALYVNEIFANNLEYSGSILLIGAILFAFQIYGDFSGYSDIAIGTARLFGFNLMQNFSYPYFSRDIAEFWRRWHISLSTWFRDYVYIPLGGSRGGVVKKVRNTFIIFIVSGFWHGANWTFIIWGALNAIYFLPLLLTKRNRINSNSIIAKDRVLPSFKEFASMISTFLLTVLAWIFFRADSVEQALELIGKILSQELLILPKGKDFVGIGIHPLELSTLILFFLLFEWFGRKWVFPIQFLFKNIKVVRILFYYLLVIIIFWYSGKEQTFIYFQF